MKETLTNVLFHISAAFGSAVYVLMKPEKRWWRNLVKFAIGYVCAMFSSNLFLSIFGYFFTLNPENVDSHLAAVGFITGVLGMTLYETCVNWIQKGLPPLLSDIVGSWLKKGDKKKDENDS